MAKIGNEAKLILKLAKEKAGHRRQEIERELATDRTDSTKMLLKGQLQGLDRYELLLNAIVTDIEAGR